MILKWSFAIFLACHDWWKLIVLTKPVLLIGRDLLFWQIYVYIDLGKSLVAKDFLLSVLKLEQNKKKYKKSSFFLPLPLTLTLTP